MTDQPKEPIKKDILNDFPFTLESIERADINEFDLTAEKSKQSTYRTSVKEDLSVEALIQETLAEQQAKALPKEQKEEPKITHKPEPPKNGKTEMVPSPIPPMSHSTPPKEEKPLVATPFSRPTPTVSSTPAPVSTPTTEQYEKTFKNYRVGDIVKGKVVKIDPTGILVDIGYKADGLIPPDKISTKSGVSPQSIIKMGDEIDAYIEALESKDGYVLLSKKRADIEKVWQLAYDSLKKKTPFEATVISVVKGGLVVDFGVRGFVPASQVAKHSDETLEQFTGRTIHVKAIEVDRRQGKAILSHKQAAGEEKRVQAQKVLEDLEVGTVRKGVVRSLKKFGAFVDLGGIEGLIHVSEMSWNRVSDPSEVLSVGQEVDVFVLGVDKENGKIALGLKQLQPDPWVEIDKLYTVGETVKGKVARTAKFGAFIELERGLEGMAHISELSSTPVKRPEEAVSIGQEVEVKILRINTEEQKIGLSIKQAQEEKEKQDLPETKVSESEGRFTLGDAVKAELEPHLHLENPASEPPPL